MGDVAQSSGEAADHEYLLDSGTDLGAEQLTCLEALFDARTREALEPLVPPGARCLELGAGSGSIAAWLASRVGPEGHVVAVDKETARCAPRLDAEPGVTVLRHDINDGLPDGSSYDLIHARMVLQHLRGREEVLRTLAAALKPGGWLVVADLVGPPLRVVSAPDPADAELFARVQYFLCHVVGRDGGINYEWAHQIDNRMTRAGLAEVHTRRETQTTSGGSPGCLLHRNYTLQVDPLLREAGLTEPELRRYQDLMDDPRFRAWFYELVLTRGRRPAE